MQEIFEKIKEKLEEKMNHSFNQRYKAFAEAIEIVNQVAEEYNEKEILDMAKVSADYAKAGLEELKRISNNGWIPFTERVADAEEREAYGCDVMLDCKLPEEDEEILVTYINGYVDTDVFLREGYECYLDSGADFVTGAIAWMPKPKGYQPKGE